jgi:hypothetical protein
VVDAEAIKDRGHLMGLRAGRERTTIGVDRARRAWRDVPVETLEVDDIVVDSGVVTFVEAEGSTIRFRTGTPDEVRRSLPRGYPVRAFVKEHHVDASDERPE